MRDSTRLSRRSLVKGLGLGAAFAATPAWARGHNMKRHSSTPIRLGFDEVRGTEINLAVGAGERIVQGRRGHGVAVNGTVPGPLIRLREGQSVQLNVTNPAVRDAMIQSMERLRMSLTPHHAGGVEVNVGQGGEQGQHERWQQEKILAGRRQWQDELDSQWDTVHDWLNTLV